MKMQSSRTSRSNLFDFAIRGAVCSAFIATVLLSQSNAVAETRLGDPSDVAWTTGPAQLFLDNSVQIALPPGYRFVGRKSASLFLHAFQNEIEGTEFGVLLPPLNEPADGPQSWSILLSYNPIGRVNDSSRQGLNDSFAQKTLQTLLSNLHQTNKQRESQNWPKITLQGWQQVPTYNTEAHCFNWTIRNTVKGDAALDFNGRILGRSGFIAARMLIAPQEEATASRSWQTLINGVSFAPGERYEDFQPGDKSANMNLGQLITGVTPEPTPFKGAPFFNLFAILTVAFSTVGAVSLRSIRRPARPMPMVQN